MKFTNAEYETLVKMLYLANWMIEEDEDLDPNNEFSVLEQKVLSDAKDYSFEANVVKDEESGSLFLSEDYEEGTEIFDVIENYDDGIFYSRLASHFASVELEKLGELSDEQYEEKEAELIEKFYERFMKTGLDGVVIE